MAEELKDVLVRLERLEEKIGAISVTSKTPKVSKLTIAEVDAYHKVVSTLWEDGTCGINETSPCVFKCNVVIGKKVVPIPIPNPTICVNECTCGPCACEYGVIRAAGYRFSGLGR